MLLDNENYNLMLVILCVIENTVYNIYTATTLDKNYFLVFETEAGSLHIIHEIYVKKSHTLVEKLHFVRWGILNEPPCRQRRLESSTDDRCESAALDSRTAKTSDMHNITLT